MAKGKVHHWKHGWIPLDAWARAQLAKRRGNDGATSDQMKDYRKSLSGVTSADMADYRDARRRSINGDLAPSSHPQVSADEARRKRYEAHLAATAEKRAATQKRYQAHLEATRKEREAMEARRLAALNRRAGVKQLAMSTSAPKAPDEPFIGDPHTKGTKYDTPVATAGMTYSAAAAKDPRVLRLKGDKAAWDSQPSYEFQLEGDKLTATEEYLRSKPINKVVSGAEPFRDGYDPEILRTDEGDIVIDGHHRVAMYKLLGKQSMVAKVIDVRGGTSVDDAVAEGAVIKGLSDDIMAKAAKAEPTTTAVLQATAKHAGGRMVSLEHRLKTAPSLARKLRDKSAAKGLTPEQYATTLNDALRYTMVTPPETYTHAVTSVLEDFRSRGYQVDEVKNTWPFDIDYKGINTTLKSPDGLPFELQFHTDGSFAAKSKQHKDFELARDPSVAPEVRKAALQRMVLNMSLLPVPSGVGEIKSTVEVKSSAI